MPSKKGTIIRYITTLTLFAGACTIMLTVYNRYESRPWTRHGMVQADIAEPAPRVGGKIATVEVSDNNMVKKGDLLFTIDPVPFQLAVETAQVNLDKARQEVTALEASIKVAKAKLKAVGVTCAFTQKDCNRFKFLYKQNSVSQKDMENAQKAFDTATASLTAAKASLIQAEVTLGQPGEDNIRIRSASLELKRARLNLSYTKVFSPVDGYITNVRISPGDFADAGKPTIAIVDETTLHITAAMKETQLGAIHEGDQAVVTLMSHPDQPLSGDVLSIGSAINPQELSSANNLVPTLPAAFDWVRLAQRVPVEIRLTQQIQGLRPIPGTTASVAITRAR